MRRLPFGLVVLLAACRAPAPSGASGEREAPRVASNVTRADYAGSEECRFCHAEIYAAWRRSPMRNMTRRAGRAHIRAPFDGTTFRVRDDSVTVEEQGGRKFMRIASSREGDSLYRVTKVVGGRHREDFVGIDVTGATDPVTDRGRGAEKVLPISYVFTMRAWRYKGYSVMVNERPGMRAGPIWAQKCITCHNTLPYLDLLLDDLLGGRSESYQGTISDDLLPPERGWSASAVEEGPLAAAVSREIVFLGGGGGAGEGGLGGVLARAITTLRRKLAGQHLVEVGIGCEACHGGAREHAERPTVLPSFEPRSPFLRVGRKTGAPPTAAEWQNLTCARCHTVLFSGYPYTWEGGLRDAPAPGGSSINSGEARDFLLGHCARELTCTACHDPHAEDPPARMRELESVRGNGVCLRCHPAYRAPAALAGHTHHRADGPGSACLACHMAKKNTGLDYALLPYHRIGSPTDEARVLHDRPLECALCHPDATVEGLVSTMERWWGRRYDRVTLRSLYGPDLGANVLAETLARGKPHEQMAAAAVLGERRVTRAIPWLAPHLAHDYPLARYWVKHALEAITGERIAVDPNEPGEVLRPAAARWLSEWQGRQASR